VSRPLKLQIVEQARALIADEQHWCRRHLAEDVNGASVSPTFAGAVKRCGLGAVVAAAYQFTHNADAAYQILRPRYSAATVIYVNDTIGHAAMLTLFDEVITAG
jgi:hypothetical protein